MRLLTAGLRERRRVLVRYDCVLRSKCNQGRVFDDLHVERVAAVRCVPVSSGGPGWQERGPVSAGESGLGSLWVRALKSSREGTLKRKFPSLTNDLCLFVLAFYPHSQRWPRRQLRHPTWGLSPTFVHYTLHFF